MYIYFSLHTYIYMYMWVYVHVRGTWHILHTMRRDEAHISCAVCPITIKQIREFRAVLKSHGRLSTLRER